MLNLTKLTKDLRFESIDEVIGGNDSSSSSCSSSSAGGCGVAPDPIDPVAPSPSTGGIR